MLKGVVYISKKKNEIRMLKSSPSVGPWQNDTSVQKQSSCCVHASTELVKSESVLNHIIFIFVWLFMSIVVYL